MRNAAASSGGLKTCHDLPPTALPRACCTWDFLPFWFLNFASCYSCYITISHPKQSSMTIGDRFDMDKFQSCCFLPRVETGGQKKSNPTAGHVTHTLFNFDIWGRRCQSNLFLKVWIFCPSMVSQYTNTYHISHHAITYYHFIPLLSLQGSSKICFPSAVLHPAAWNGPTLAEPFSGYAIAPEMFQHVGLLPSSARICWPASSSIKYHNEVAVRASWNEF